MDMLALLSLSIDVRAGRDLALRDLGQLSLDIECEGTEFLDVYTLTGS